MNILIIDNGTIHIDELVSLFPDHQVKLFKYRRHSRIDLEWADMFVLSGGNRPVLFKRYYSHEINLILQTDKPIIGICLGFELIAIAHNVKLNRWSQKYRGLKTIEIIPGSLDLEYSTKYSVFEAHVWRASSAPGFEVIATSDFGAEIVKHPTRPIIGFQFHPEVNEPANDGKRLFRASFDRILEEYNNARIIDTLSVETADVGAAND